MKKNTVEKDLNKETQHSSIVSERHKDKASVDIKKKSLKALAVFGVGVLFFIFVTIGTVISLKLSFFSVQGNSMLPTFEDKDTIVLQQKELVEHNQIIVFKKPDGWSDYVDTNSLMVKRVVAKPWDTVSYKSASRELSVNGEVVKTLPDSYSCNIEDFEYTLNKTEVFAIGDNTEGSLDSLRIACDGSIEKSFIPSTKMVNHGEVIFKF